MIFTLLIIALVVVVIVLVIAQPMTARTRRIVAVLLGVLTLVWLLGPYLPLRVAAGP